MSVSSDKPEDGLPEHTHTDFETVKMEPDEAGFGDETVSTDLRFDDGGTELKEADELSHKTTVIDAVRPDPETILDLPLSLADEELDDTKELGSDGDTQSENTLKPNWLRSALVVLLLAATVGWTLLNVVLLHKQQTERGLRYDVAKTGQFVVSSVNARGGDQLRIGDELIGINGGPFTREKYLEIESTLPPGDIYTLDLRRDGQPLTIELVAHPVSTAGVLGRYFLGLLLPLGFLFVGATVFLLKPNDKSALLLVVSFSLLSVAIPPDSNSYFINQLPAIVNLAFRTVNDLGMAGTAVLLNLFLIFPRRQLIMRRFPALEYLIYILCFFLAVLPFWFADMYLTGWFDVQSPSRHTLLVISNISVGIFLLAALAALLTGYFQASLTDKRRIQIIAAGFALIAVPNVFALTASTFLNTFTGDWLFFFVRLSTIILPFIFAYAIVRHKVIPISLVIRRGLQYLLATNALRLLLLIPVGGIVWNAVADPHRRLDEIFLHNSLGFYVCVVAGAVLILISRFGLREWIDKKFFRQQYVQEVILRELSESVKESDSLPVLSRLVSERIQKALHPTSVYLFFRDQDRGSDFSLSYTTTGGDDTNHRLASESPLLQFMETERRSIEFPDPRTAELPVAERSWLRSIGANLLVPMHGTDGKLAGFFTLGEKMSEIPYTGRDRELLETVANQIALMHENLTLKDRVRQEQKIRTEVLSRVDASSLNLLKECPKCGLCYDRKAERCDIDRAELIFTLPVERLVENRYRLVRLLGKGAMGAVYEATDIRIGRTVAIKILSGAMFGNRDALRRFEKEARTTGRLKHRNVVTIFDFGTLTTEGAFLVMELVRGESLRQVLDREKKLGSRMMIDWFTQVLDGIEAAHEAGIIHRDLKPANILVTRGDDEPTRLCILDFGLAREIESDESVTVPGTIMGTFGYMAPEQLRGERADKRSDLFAVGVMIYEALYGKRPFAGKTYTDMRASMAKRLTFDPEGKWPSFLQRALEIDANRRFASAGEMREKLRGK